MSDLVRVKNRVHGGVAALPVSALKALPDWEPVDGPTPERPKPRVELSKPEDPSEADQPSAPDENKE